MIHTVASAAGVGRIDHSICFLGGYLECPVLLCLTLGLVQQSLLAQINLAILFVQRVIPGALLSGAVHIKWFTIRSLANSPLLGQGFLQALHFRVRVRQPGKD